MENMISSNWRLILIGILLGLSISACKKEKTNDISEQPTIEIKEVGTNNSKVAYTGFDLHIDAEVKAPRKISSIKLQITLAETNYGWDLVKIYKDGYAGTKNADFHEHVDVPATAKPGIYTLLLLVTDENGKTAQTKVNFEVVKDLTLPSIENILLKTVSASTLNISGTIKAPNKVEKLVVEVQSSAWTKEYTYIDADMVGQTSYILNKDVDITGSPAGHYHVNITLTDKAGKSTGYHYHIDK